MSHLYLDYVFAPVSPYKFSRVEIIISVYLNYFQNDCHDISIGRVTNMILLIQQYELEIVHILLSYLRIMKGHINTSIICTVSPYNIVLQDNT